MTAMKALRGVTLIELLVAIAIFAVLGVMSYRAVTQTVSSQQRLEAEFDEWRQLARALGRVESELQQIGWRYRDVVHEAVEASPTQTALRFEQDESGVNRISFWRVDARQGARFTAFEFKENRLDLLRWPQGDTQQTPRRETLVRDVRSAKWSFAIKGKTQWLPSLASEEGRTDDVPQGVRLTLETEQFGTITRTFALR